MAELKTQVTPVDPAEFIAGLDRAWRRDDAAVLDRLFRDVTGWVPRMWGDAIIGYGAYDYNYASGRSGRFLATGFSPRKSQHSIYIMPGYQDFSDILKRLGPHKLGKACLYVRRLDTIDTDVLAELIAAGLARLREIYPVQGTPP